MKYLVPLFLLLAAPAAMAQTAVACPGSGPTARYCETQPCAAGSCSRSAAPTGSEFSTPVAGYPNGKGLPLTSQAGAYLWLCAESGQTLSGTGTIRIWGWAPQAPTLVVPNKTLEVDIADVWYSGARCVPVLDWPVAGGSSRKVIAEASSVTVSGGSTISFYWFGLAVQ